jgi:nucleoid DNA-binding protein
LAANSLTAALNIRSRVPIAGFGAFGLASRRSSIGRFLTAGK